MLEIDNKTAPIQTVTYSTSVSILNKKRRGFYMGCSSENYSGHDGHCVADVVRGIVKAQHRVEHELEDTCATSCDRSIEDLLSPGRDDRNRRRHNTIPFTLFCKNSCKPFIGSGIVKSNRYYKCIESPVFRAKGFVSKSKSCVRIELLKPVRGGGYGDGDQSRTKDVEFNDLDGRRGSHGHSKDHNCGCSVCDFFPSDRIRSLRPTGICITVDLNAFFGISCLDPVTIR